MSSDRFQQIEPPSSVVRSAKDEATQYSCVRLFPRRTLHLTVEETLAEVLAGRHPNPLHPSFAEVWMPGSLDDDPDWRDQHQGVVNVLHTLCDHWRETTEAEDLTAWLGDFRCGLSNRELKTLLPAMVERGWLNLQGGKLTFPAKHCPILKFKQLWEARQNVSAE